MYYDPVAKEGQRDELFMGMMREGQMTQGDIAALIARRPDVYGKYKGFLKP
jgi:hypothetical protein